FEALNGAANAWLKTVDGHATIQRGGEVYEVHSILAYASRARRRTAPPHCDPQQRSNDRSRDAESECRDAWRKAAALESLGDRDRRRDDERDHDRGARSDRREGRGDHEEQAGLDPGVVRSGIDRDEPQTSDARHGNDEGSHDGPHGRSSLRRSASTPSSRVRWYAAYTAFDSTVRSAPFSSWEIAAALDRPCEVTMLRSSARCRPLLRAKSAEPSTVRSTSSSATRREKPRCTPASTSASINRKTYVGPVPESAVAMSTRFSSSTISSSPSAPSIAFARSRCSASTDVVDVHAVTPMPTCAGVFGMARTIAAWSRPWRSARRVAPATMEMTSLSSSSFPRSSRITVPRTCGFTESTMTCASAAASAFDASAFTPYVFVSSARRSRRGPVTSTWDGGTR